MENEELSVFQKRVVYQVPGMDRVQVERDRVYALGQGDELKLDVYKPAGVAASVRLPGVVFIHGGPLPADLRPLPKDWGVYKSYGELIAASGMIGITLNHRFHGWEQLEQAMGDVTAALRYIQTHGDALNLDGERLCLRAFSGGGSLLSGALNKEYAGVKCLIAYYAMLDLQQAHDPAQVMSQASLQKFSPLYHLNLNPPAHLPMFIARAGLDSAELNAALERFLLAALSANIPVDFANHPNGRHGFDIFNPDARSREIIARTIEFIRANV